MTDTSTNLTLAHDASGVAAVSDRRSVWTWFIVQGDNIVDGPYPNRLIRAELSVWRSTTGHPGDVTAVGFSIGTVPTTLPEVERRQGRGA